MSAIKLRADQASNEADGVNFASPPIDATAVSAAWDGVARLVADISSTISFFRSLLALEIAMQSKK